MADWGVNSVKYLVFAFNLLFALTGIAIITVGAYIQASYHHYSNFVGEDFWTAPILLIVVGVIVFIIAFLGCCGAVRESHRMVLGFSIALILVFLFEIGIGIAGYTKHDQLKEILEKGFNRTMVDYKENIAAWDLLQTELVCCGTNGPQDWEDVFHNKTIPDTCCNEALKVLPCTMEFAHKDGCMPKLLTLLDDKSVVLTAVGIGVALLQLIGLAYACCLYRAFRRNYESV